MARIDRNLLFLAISISLLAIHQADAQRSVAQPWSGARGIQKTTAEIMADPAASKPRKRYPKPEREIPGREDRPQNPLSPSQSRWPVPNKTISTKTVSAAPLAPQTIGTSFTGATLADTGAFPPDSMGAIGLSQFIVFVNGRLRTFNKTTGLADGVINVDPDVFFSSVMTPESPPGLNFTSDPQIRYDRLSGRWILTIIDVPSTSSSSIADTPNRLLLAVSDAASAGVISPSTVWTFYLIQQNTVGGGDTGEFLDYDSLGVDNNALYIGGNMFGAVSGSFVTTSGFVVRKSSILNGGPVVTTAFRGLITGGDGPDSPRGVDNYNPTSTEGYFIGPSDAAFGRLIVRRVSDPGGTPIISGNISITVNSTSFPITVDHLGNAGGTGGRLDALDDRLFAAQIRNGRLWTAHNIAVNTAGVASTTGQRRDGVRWYELNVPVGSGTPTVVQAGTIFDSANTVSTARQFWIPSVAVSGQGHAALGFSTAGTPYYVDAATCGRLASDALGTLGAATLYTASATAYNPSGDSGSSSGRRWGDYSFTSVDPEDDMTMWTIQEFCNATNSYGVRVAKSVAPPPATPASCSPAIADHGAANLNVVLTGTSTSGSGFFDPGNGFAKHLSATVSGTGVTVNSVAYTDPSHLTLDLSVSDTATLGAHAITVTNPDGQTAASSGGILTINPQANLFIAQTASPDPVAAGYQLTYNLTTTNSGPDTATNVVVTENLPPEATFVSATPAPSSQSGVQLTFNLGSLTNGTTVTIQITVAVPSSTTGTLSATATISSDLDDLNSKDNSASVTIDVLADSDHDGIPDDWEITNGLDPNDPDDATADSDGDGFTNLQEYFAGTDPQNGNSIWSANVNTNGSDVQISFKSISGRTYRVEKTDDLASSSWSVLVDNIAGTGGVITITDANALSAPQRFYHVLVSP